MGTPPDRQRGGRRERHSPPDPQPGFPTGEARLIDVRTAGADGAAVEVVLDTGHAYEVATGSLPAGLPQPGGVVTPELAQALALAAERKIVARLVFAMLDRRLMPLARVRDKLADRGHRPEAIGAVLDQLVAKGIYSDRRYAEAFCRDCLLSRAVGRRYLVQKLRDKRVDPGLAATVADEILDRETEAELADRAATERWRRLRGAADQRAVAKVVRFLMGRGFAAGLANGAARRTRPRDEAADAAAE